MTEKKCGNCVYCIADDGHPYCALKDLFTNVNLDDDCDETDGKGRNCFTSGEHIKSAIVLGEKNEADCRC